MHTQIDVIHGDIHPGNVAIDQVGRMVLIDFGEAKFGHIRNRDFVTKQAKLVCDEWNSVWESRNQVSSYRDVYRAVLIIATLIHGASLLESIAETCYMYIDVDGDETSYYMQIKQELNFFDIVIDYNGGDEMDSDSEIENPTFKLVDTDNLPRDPDTVAHVRELISELLALVRYPRERMDLHDYTGILMTLEHIYEYLMRERSLHGID
jgi:serine/threonine protein kinase